MARCAVSNIDIVCNELFNRHKNEIGLYAENISQFVQAVFELMPNLESINCNSSNNSEIGQLLCGSLAAAYYRSIKKIISCGTLFIPEIPEFKNITYLDINLENTDSIQKAKFSSETLKYLRMYNVPPKFSWTIFTPKNKSLEIKFSNLTTLKIAYNSYYKSKSPSAANTKLVDCPRLYFPKLKVLDIMYHEDYQPSINCELFSDKLHTLRVSCTTNALCLVDNENLFQIDNLSLTVIANNDDEQEINFSAINRIIMKAKNVNYAVIDVHNQEVLRQINNANNLPITGLNISHSVDADTIIYTVKHLQNLSNLFLNNLIITKEQAHSYTSAFSMYEPDNLVPLNKNLKKLNLVCRNPEFTSADFTIFVGHLLPRLPSLVDLQVKTLFSGTVIKFL
ncbi:hypothetical protein COEREDRAFT_88120 [Coemansia reversa NRRL 1564]|uniref:RNI-like protein n=1 Tax=Coemansia reversa (strain ATCC 12441 / NRRL 1564) TaxID=763665 RepID=A0A2G5B972_COERN|nr:hypothetical protein COEREDRAFT_88120 [Coemansia reversa NRRL 1564]|eukprot:PIA15277.1 hypothetical protein COEREDRAFT_88120 [Coemansia reversa NRRL 1564]